MKVVLSQNNVPIRLTEERWLHISVGHPEVAAYYDEIIETVAEPDVIYKGGNEELIALKKLNDFHLVVVYKELSEVDGFLITAYLTRKTRAFANKETVWKRS